ncbi:MAG: hypothetical protein Q8M65_10585 [Rhodoglobus sp.]|nr:hypothetical protein [Rhodoglobus sp.]
MSRSRNAAFPLVLVAALALAGCSANDGYPIFDRPPEASDSIPDDFGDNQVKDLDLDTARLAGEFNRNSLYLVRSTSGSICLAIYPAGFVSCGGDGPMGAYMIGVGTFEVSPTPQADKEGWTRISENIIAKRN